MSRILGLGVIWVDYYANPNNNCISAKTRE